MKSKNLLEILKSGFFTVPLYLFKIKDEFKVSTNEFIFLIYLTSLGDKFIFNPKDIGMSLNLELGEVMKIISLLSEKNLISVDVIKNDKGIMEEYINLELFYEKVNMILLNNVNKESTDKTSIFDVIGEEFGRLLSPIEIEIVNAWIDSNIKEELIMEALKEAIMNGVTNLRYIDKILYEWGKKGYKTKEDVRKNKIIRDESSKKDKPKKEVFDYNWLEDDE